MQHCHTALAGGESFCDHNTWQEVTKQKVNCAHGCKVKSQNGWGSWHQIQLPLASAMPTWAFLAVHKLTKVYALLCRITCVCVCVYRSKHNNNITLKSLSTRVKLNLFSLLMLMTFPSSRTKPYPTAWKMMCEITSLYCAHVNNEQYPQIL